MVPAASVKHISHRRFLATFQLDEVSKGEQDLYRCVTQSSRGSGVSNFAELIVKGGCPPSSQCTALLLTPDSGVVRALRLHSLAANRSICSGTT